MELDDNIADRLYVMICVGAISQTAVVTRNCMQQVHVTNVI
jgi:hypothetical protein